MQIVDEEAGEKFELSKVSSCSDGSLADKIRNANPFCRSIHPNAFFTKFSNFNSEI